MNNEQRYWQGRKNFIARGWYYILQGLDLINSFKYLGAFILGIYAILKLTNPWVMVVIFLISLPLLLIAGYLKAWHVNKVVDWLTVELGTHWGRHGYNLQEKTLEQLIEINNKLSK